MRQATLRNISRPSAPAIRVQYCTSFWSKFKGLMFKKRLEKDTGILLVEKKDSILNTSIHMFFMAFDIAIVWIDSSFRVVDKKVARRWHPAYSPCQPAKFVLETTTDQINNFEVNEHINIEIR
jgi:uncharacterized membrane protein (UPF0127 family)